MNVAVVLGYQLNLDGSMDKILVKRLNLALQLLNEEKIDKVIVTGGRPKKEIEVSEAQRMYEYLVEKGVDPEAIIKEEKANSTFGNAKYSVPMAKELGAKKIIIVSTIEHFTNYDYNPLKIFSEFIEDDDVRLVVYTNSIPTL